MVAPVFGSPGGTIKVIPVEIEEVDHEEAEKPNDDLIRMFRMGTAGSGFRLRWSLASESRQTVAITFDANTMKLGHGTGSLEFRRRICDR